MLFLPEKDRKKIYELKIPPLLKKGIELYDNYLTDKYNNTNKTENLKESLIYFYIIWRKVRNLYYLEPFRSMIGLFVSSISLSLLRIDLCKHFTNELLIVGCAEEYSDQMLSIKDIIDFKDNI